MQQQEGTVCTAVHWSAWALTVMLSLSTSVATAQRDEPLPLDPLTANEQAVADTIARSDRRVREFLRSGAGRLINVEFSAAKDPADTSSQGDVAPRRAAEVLYYRTDRDQGLRVLVDLASRRVTAAAPVLGQSVPISSEEIVQAARLALADDRVIRLFGGRLPRFTIATRPATRAETDVPRIEGLRSVAVVSEDPCYGRRCVVLFFRVRNRYVHVNRVVVDLTGQQVFIRESDQ
jgi:hypothetical protein